MELRVSLELYTLRYTNYKNVVEPPAHLIKVTYTLLPKATWNITMHAQATEETPIMLSG